MEIIGHSVPVAVRSNELWRQRGMGCMSPTWRVVSVDVAGIVGLRGPLPHGAIYYLTIEALAEDWERVVEN
jgi:hypothetical protein